MAALGYHKFMQTRLGLVRLALLVLGSTGPQFPLALSKSCVFQAREESLMRLWGLGKFGNTP